VRACAPIVPQWEQTTVRGNAAGGGEGMETEVPSLGNDVFQGGFLGMDNIGPFDRGKLPPGYLLGQADGTSWMATFARSMLGIALILAQHNPVYEDVASK
jgi:hypothetical protein